MLPGATVLFEPFPSNDYSHAMWWQVSSGFAFAMVGGYIIGPAAPGAEALQARIHSLATAGSRVTLSGTDQLALVGGLRSLGVNDVVVGHGASAGVSTLFTRLFDAEPIVDGGFLIWQVPVYHG
jgi:hypothetical protein